MRGKREGSCEEVEELEDEHIYTAKAGCRELWIQSPRVPTVLPPLRGKDVRAAIGAACAEKAREEML